MTYTPETFRNCQFNPYEEDIFGTYPQLESIVVKDDHVVIDDEDAEIYHRVPSDKLARYIVALYDPKSPLIRGETNLIRRKEVAAGIAGFDLGKEADMLQVIYDCKYEHVVLMIQNFLKDFVKSMEWAMVVSYESAFWEFQSRVMQPIDRGDKDRDLVKALTEKTQLAEDIKILHEKFEAARDQFYGNDEVLIKSVNKIRRYTPEGIAAFAKGNGYY